MKPSTVLAVSADAAPVQPAHAVRWHCPRRADYLLQLWPDGAVVYDEASGDIHALSPIAGELLQQVLAVPQSCSENLAQALLGEQPTAQDVRGVDKLLQDFEFLGFIEPCGA
ncbi:MULTISPECIES: HPr-rel-A system PqqD family peptide chaperone [unclassified Acidovorax]|uniref:HPr-rel-A system PqqD family peptide chaperone n=1 Tax=unclassified Acidovorax TaxID=2684926 RepID=UPI0012FADF5E|nr:MULTISPECIES: HPr-rel-A system PqqD family peptide chaperone [unclassified Acidovorax]MBP3979616.1 HPr-rel-A system PqqD family peptide chaperone [Acidovorax sp. JG5]MBU4424149.1 HPr-rel-A system PqqD family peptide chaperone [Gammaproteobacteria bacterium]